MTSAVTAWSVASPLLIVSSALVLIALERAFPYRPGQAIVRKGFWTDLIGYALIQSYLLGLVIAHVITWLDGATGLSRLHLVGGWPVPAQVLFFVVTHDLYIYLFHRLQHGSPLLWRIHEAHHATADVDWLSGSRSHVFEILINQTIEFAPLVLLGAAPEVAIIKLTIDAIWGMYIHSNIDVRSGRSQWFLNGPEMHRWHHAIEIRDGVNFATKLPVWDWLFRTAYLPEHKPSGYGLADVRFPSGYLAQQVFAFRPPNRASFPTLQQLGLRLRSRLFDLGMFVGRLGLIVLVLPLAALAWLYEKLRPPRSRSPRREGRPRILFVCGTINHTSQLRQIAAALPECEHAFTWYYCDGLLEILRRCKTLEATALGAKLRARCRQYLEAHHLRMDLGGRAGDYDLAVTCSDLAVPRNIRGIPVVLVQEGMTDPEDLIFRLVRLARLDPWLTTTSSATGLSHKYERFCVASEGYRDLFRRKGVSPDKLVVTGIPNFDNCDRYRDNQFPHRGFVLVCSSDIRETWRWEDRPVFIQKVLAIAAGRQVIWKLHPNENVPRARGELERLAPAALIFESGSAEEMIANCDVLITQFSSTAYVGLALDKEVHSYFDVDELRRLCPLQNGAASGSRIASVCRALLAARATPP